MADSTTAPAADAKPAAHGDGHGHGQGQGDGHGHGHHPSWLAHHFDTPLQQFDAGKLGMWLFLATELLFFGGLFCAYSVYRSNHPEVFQYAHRFLDTNLGAFNTAVLIFSSFTMALGVRCAQLANRKGLIINLAITIACAFIFLGVKYVEYSHKIHEGLVWGRAFSPTKEVEREAYLEMLKGAQGKGGPGAGAESAHAEAAAPKHEQIEVPADFRPRDARIFFSIYYCMTGLHAIHIIIGIGVLFWILKRAINNEFHGQYFGPVDYVGLYWHLVDLIWIYLFPLLYLIR